MRRPASYSSSRAAAVRQRYALSQQELGDYLGVSAQMVAHVEGGRYNFSEEPAERLRRLSRLLEVAAGEVVLPGPGQSRRGSGAAPMPAPRPAPGI